MKSTVFALTALAMGTATFAQAQVSFGTRSSAAEALTVAEIETALGVSNTFAIDGVEIGPDVSSDPTVFLVHLDTSGDETFAQVNLTTKTAIWTKSVAQLKADLGGVYNSTATFPILVGELTYDPNSSTSGTLYFADSSTVATSEYAVLAIDVATQNASEVLRDTGIGGWNSQGVLSNGRLVAALGEDYEATFALGEPNVGWVDPADVSPAYTQVYDMDDFVTAAGLPGTSEVPPETIGVNPANDDVYVFGHDEFELFRIEDFDGVSPTLTRLNISGWTGSVDFHGLAVDTDANIYGFDEGTPDIEIFDANASAPITPIALSTIGSEIGLVTPGDFEVTLWRGLKATKTSATTSRLYLASGTADAGIVAIDFGSGPASVVNWEVFQ